MKIKRKNIPTDYLDDPQIIANGNVNLVNGYLTLGQSLNTFSSGGFNPEIVTVYICVNGTPKRLDVYATGKPY